MVTTLSKANPSFVFQQLGYHLSQLAESPSTFGDKVRLLNELKAAVQDHDVPAKYVVHRAALRAVIDSLDDINALSRSRNETTADRLAQAGIVAAAQCLHTPSPTVYFREHPVSPEEISASRERMLREHHVSLRRQEALRVVVNRISAPVRKAAGVLAVRASATLRPVGDEMQRRLRECGDRLLHRLDGALSRFKRNKPSNESQSDEIEN